MGSEERLLSLQEDPRQSATPLERLPAQKTEIVIERKTFNRLFKLGRLKSIAALR
ncbi:MAG: hypothetical protein ACI8X5_001878 [Planctomycetota bacterium]|jgi:hypothetical protein